MRLISVTYFPSVEDSASSEALCAAVAEYQHYWIRQGRCALISTDIDPRSLFDSITPLLGEFDTVIVSTVIDPLCVRGRDSDAVWEWIDRFASPN